MRVGQRRRSSTARVAAHLEAAGADVLAVATSLVQTRVPQGRTRQQTRASHRCDEPPEGATFLLRDIITKGTP